MTGDPLTETVDRAVAVHSLISELVEELSILDLPPNAHEEFECLRAVFLPLTERLVGELRSTLVPGCADDERQELTDRMDSLELQVQVIVMSFRAEMAEAMLEADGFLHRNPTDSLYRAPDAAERLQRSIKRLLGLQATVAEFGGMAQAEVGAWVAEMIQTLESVTGALAEGHLPDDCLSPEELDYMDLYVDGLIANTNLGMAQENHALRSWQVRMGKVVDISDLDE